MVLCVVKCDARYTFSFFHLLSFDQNFRKHFEGEKSSQINKKYKKLISKAFAAFFIFRIRTVDFSGKKPMDFKVKTYISGSIDVEDARTEGFYVKVSLGKIRCNLKTEKFYNGKR